MLPNGMGKQYLLSTVNEKQLENSKLVVCLIQYFEADLISMESQPQNPEFRNNPENFHPCGLVILHGLVLPFNIEDRMILQKILEEK